MPFEAQVRARLSWEEEGEEGGRREVSSGQDREEEQEEEEEEEELEVTVKVSASVGWNRRLMARTPYLSSDFH